MKKFISVWKVAVLFSLVTSGLTVSYSIDNNTFSVGKDNFGQFWTYSEKLFGVAPAANIG